MTPGSAPRPDPTEHESKGAQWKRLGASFGTVLLLHLISLIPLPGVDSGFDMAILAQEPPLHPLLFGLYPILSAFMLVEIFAAGIPRFRRLRQGGPKGREKLRRVSIAAAILLAAFQAVVFLHNYKTSGLARFPHGLLLPSLCLLCGTATVLWAAGFIDRRGMDNGCGNLLVYEFTLRTYQTLQCFFNGGTGAQNVYDRFDGVFGAGLPVAVVIATVHLLRNDWEKSTLPEKNPDASETWSLRTTVCCSWFPAQ